MAKIRRDDLRSRPAGLIPARSAQMGHTAAMNSIGSMYREGRSVAQSDKRAVEWYRKAAELGEPGSMTNLGSMILTGRGIAQSDEQAMRWYRKAAESGSAFAMFAVARGLATGRGVNKNKQEAVKWYRRAADNGEANALTKLAAMYDTGQGIERDTQIAAELILKALQKNNRKCRQRDDRQFRSMERAVPPHAPASDAPARCLFRTGRRQIRPRDTRCYPDVGGTVIITRGRNSFGQNTRT